ncbi:histidine--tRNA ligase [Leucothrix pacifica]|uniref:Histidine--tRNA ligase n=1 Tax=Leucothrix pacifica TaxID=1247513 RepID=A0A317CNT2_9GAMM|nr:histidine--tRNA ligase [Leucothrix pacifica]PWQ99143.1 histidine--tRNA ligase [Leucothrix pacifica]
MPKVIQSIRGMHDILPDQSAAWQHLEGTIRTLFTQYGYRELRTPVLEPTELFCRSIGEVTDIVEKEMYTFDDRNGDSLTLRPECTASCVRAGIQNGLLYNQQQRIWYIGPMFRHERPQKGRYRQFYQAGIETYGIPGPDIDAEVIAVSARLWRTLGIKNVELQLNSLGSNEARMQYREVLIEYLKQHEDVLDEDAKRRMLTNPLRVLDSKNPKMADIIAAAPQLLDHLDDESKEHFDRLKMLLDEMGIEYVINPRLVRGLDYYCRTVFEWVTTELGTQGTICAGGRYDGLVEQLGGKPTTGLGFAMGLERILLLLEEQNIEVPALAPHIYIVMQGEEAETSGLTLSETLRNQLPQLRIMSNCASGSFKAQMKRADKSGAEYAIILGDNELSEGVVTIKPLRNQGEQCQVSRNGLVEQLTKTAFDGE